MAAVGGVAPHRHEPIGLERRKCAEIAELLPRNTQGAGAPHAGAGALARQQVAGRYIEFQRLHAGARGVGRRDRHIAIDRRVVCQRTADHAGAGIEAQARGQHAVGANHHIFDAVDVVVVGRGSALEAERPQRLIGSLVISYIFLIIGQHFIDIHLQPPFVAHGQADGQEDVLA